MTARLLPLRSLGHPLWFLSLVVLALNDHWLKYADLAPAWVTGKLSDVAGLVVAPAVLAGVLCLRSRRSLLGAHLATGLGLAGINLWPAVARGVESATAWTPLPWTISCDATDLLALPALWLSWRFLVPAMARPTRLSPVSGRLMLAAGALCCVATTEGPASDWEPGPVIFPEVTARAVLVNDAKREIVVRVHRLRNSVKISCPAVQGDPGGTLSRRLFAPATAWRIANGRAVAFEGTAALTDGGEVGCSVYLVDGGGLDPMLIFIDFSDRPQKSIATQTDDISAADGIRVRDAGDGVGLGWVDHPLLFAPPPLIDFAATSACALSADEDALGWTAQLPTGTQTLQELITSPDGCAGLDLESGDASTIWHVCAPPGALPFKQGDNLTFQKLSAGHAGGKIEGVAIGSGTATVRLARGADLVPFGKGTFKPIKHKGCSASTDSCGGLTLPLSVQLSGADTPGGSANITAGQSAQLGAKTTLTLIRARRPLVASAPCTAPEDLASDRYESVWTSTEDSP